MGSLYLLDLADVCRSTGYPVVEVDGWQTNARGSGGYDPGQPGHVIVHHTASGPSSDPANGGGDVDYCAHGHPDSPVGNLYLSRDGSVHVMAAGAANTNGTGADPCGLVPDDGMNSRSLAIEAGNGGTGEAWPPIQQAAYVTLVAALCAAYGIDIPQVHSHAEWAPSRKIDPGGPSRWASDGTWPMDGFRADVAAGGSTPPDQEDFVDQAQFDQMMGALNGMAAAQQAMFERLGTFGPKSDEGISQRSLIYDAINDKLDVVIQLLGER